MNYGDVFYDVKIFTPLLLDELCCCVLRCQDLHSIILGTFILMYSMFSTSTKYYYWIVNAHVNCTVTIFTLLLSMSYADVFYFVNIYNLLFLDHLISRELCSPYFHSTVLEFSLLMR